jgi:hypothetical protein
MPEEVFDAFAKLVPRRCSRGRWRNSAKSAQTWEGFHGKRAKGVLEIGLAIFTDGPA